MVLKIDYFAFPISIPLIRSYFLAVTLGGLIYLPKRLKIWDPPMDDEENVQLLKQAGAKRRRNIRRNN